MSGELAYTLRWLGEGSGTTYELVIQTPRRVDQEVDVDTRSSASTKNVLSVRSMLQHLEAVRAATTLSVELFDVYVADSLISYTSWVGRFRGLAVERWSLTGEPSVSCARPTADG